MSLLILIYEYTFLKPCYFSYILQRNNVHGGGQRGDDHPDPQLSPQEPADPHYALLGEPWPDTIILTLLNRYLADHLFHWPSKCRFL